MNQLPSLKYKEPVMNDNRTLSRLKKVFAAASALAALSLGGTAFAASITDCTGCHGMPPLDNAFRNITTGAFSGNHETHATATNCGHCHKPQSGNAHRNGRIEFVNNIHNSRLVARYRNVTSTPQDPNPTTDTCTNVNCHFESRTPQRGIEPLATAPFSALQNSCAVCHGAPPTTGNHPYGIQKHGLYYGTDTNSCSYCHPDHTTNPKPFAHATSAGTRGLLLQFTKAPNTGGSYSGDVSYPLYLYNPARAGSCSNLYCHSPGTSNGPVYSAPEQTPKWDIAFGESCLGCHKGDVASGSPMSSGSHLAHNGLGQLANIDCIRCHSLTVSGPRTIGTRANHVNKVINLAFDSVAGGTAGKYGGEANPLTKTPGTAYRKCTNVYCHSNGTTTVAPFNNYSVTWGGSLPNDCTGCHGSNSTTARIQATGNHRKHIDVTFNAPLGTANGCVECHAKTVSNNVTIINKSMHINTYKDYSGAKAGRIVAGTCNTVYCHSSGQATPAYRTLVPWSNDSTSYNCKSCHGASAGGDTPVPPAGVFASQYGEPNYNNYSSANRNWFNTHNSKHVKSAASCAVCHINTTADGLAIREGTTLHANQQRNVSFDTVKAGNNNPYYDNVTKTCNNVYCHSNGRRTGTVYKTPRWGGASLTGNCNYCHPIASLSGVHATHVNGLIPTFYNFTANRSVGTTYQFGCSNCHPMDAATYHADGIVEVTIRKTNPGAGGNVPSLKGKNGATADFINTPNSGITGTSGLSVTCSLAYCHSNGYLSGGTYVYATTRDWYANPGDFTGDKCASCHGNSPNTTIPGSPAHYDASNWLGSGKPGGHIVGVHYNNIYAAANANGFATAGTTGTSSHGNATYSTTITCSTCHNDTVTVSYNDKSVNCSTASCHDTGVRLKGTMAIASAVKHVNGSVDIKFNAITVKSKAQLRNTPTGWTRTGTYKTSGSYDSGNTSLSSATYTAGTKTCANVACHFGNSVRWVDTGGGTTCVSCHSSL